MAHKQGRGMNKYIKSRMGYTHDEIFKTIKEEIPKGKSSVDIAKIFNINSATVLKITKKMDLEEYNKLKLNGEKKRNNSNYKDGQSSLYMKLRKDIREGKISCEKCKTNKNVEIHHKEKINHCQYWKATNFNNHKNNIMFLCNSCHQKHHYRNLDKVHKVNHCPKTGKFLTGKFQEVTK